MALENASKKRHLSLGTKKFRNSAVKKVSPHPNMVCKHADFLAGIYHNSLQFHVGFCWFLWVFYNFKALKKHLRHPFKSISAKISTSTILPATRAHMQRRDGAGISIDIINGGSVNVGEFLGSPTTPGSGFLITTRMT